jgi:hypothetical protein
LAWQNQKGLARVLDEVRKEAPPMVRPIRIALAAALGLVLALASNFAVLAAWPSIIMVYGDGLPTPIFLSDSGENSALMSAATEADISNDELAGRRYFRLAFFWGNAWDEYVNSGKPVTELTAQQANQYGRYYPATAKAHAVLTFDSVPGPGALRRSIKPEGVRVLSSHGIPANVDTRQRGSSSQFPWLAVLVAALVAGAVGLGAIKRA